MNGICILGKGLEKDEDRAVRAYQELAEQGHMMAKVASFLHSFVLQFISPKTSFFNAVQSCQHVFLGTWGGRGQGEGVPALRRVQQGQHLAGELQPW